MCFTQNDTIYLNENYIKFNGGKYNYIENEVRSGKWIEYQIDDQTLVMRLSSGDKVHWHDQITSEFRAPKANEYDGLEILISQNSDTIDGSIYYDRIYVTIESKIPPEKYFITAKGKYTNNIKEGKWTYFHNNGKLKKEINYKKGIPNKGFKIYRTDGTIMIEVKIIGIDKWELIKYDELYNIISSESTDINDLDKIY